MTKIQHNKRITFSYVTELNFSVAKEMINWIKSKKMRVFLSVKMIFILFLDFVQRYLLLMVNSF